MIPNEPVRGSFAYLEHPSLFGPSGLDQFRVATATSSALIFEGRSWIRDGATTTIDEAPADAHA